MSRTDEKLNVLDYLQLVWFDFCIKSAVKRNSNYVYSTVKVRKKVANRLEKVGYNVYIYRTGHIQISW